jgi:DNA-binding transcriptional LysR family regulator
VQLDGYQRHELLIEELVAVIPATNPLAKATEVALPMLEHEPWVDHDIYDSPIGQIVLSACRAAGFIPRYAARLDDHRTALRMVAAGIGITVLPRLAAVDLPDGLVAMPVSDPRVLRRIVVHARRNQRHGDLIDYAVSQLRRRVSVPG